MNSKTQCVKEGIIRSRLGMNLNKTRETRVLSRPTICWIHYVQISLSISAEHLSQASQPSILAKHLSRASQPSISEILKNAQ